MNNTQNKDNQTENRDNDDKIDLPPEIHDGIIFDEVDDSGITLDINSEMRNSFPHEINSTRVPFKSYDRNSKLEILEIESNNSFKQKINDIKPQSIYPSLFQLCICFLQIIVLVGIVYIHFINPNIAMGKNNTNCGCNSTVYHVVNNSISEEWLINYLKNNDITFNSIVTNEIRSDVLYVGNNQFNGDQLKVNNILSETANIDEFQTKYIYINNGTCKNLDIENFKLDKHLELDSAKIDNLISVNSQIDSLKLNNLDTNNMKSIEANITKIYTHNITSDISIMDRVNVNLLNTEHIISKTSNIYDITGENLNVEMINSERANITKIYTSNITSNVSNIGIINSDLIITNRLNSGHIESQTGDIFHLDTVTGNIYNIIGRNLDMDIIVSNRANISHIYVDSGEINRLITLIADIQRIMGNHINSFNITSDYFTTHILSIDNLDVNNLNCINITTGEVYSNFIYSDNGIIYNITNEKFMGKTINSDKLYGNHMNNCPVGKCV